MSDGHKIFYYKMNELARQIFALYHSEQTEEELISEIVFLVQQALGYQAVGLRVNDGLDYPYFFTRGFDQDFVEKEMHLCQQNGSDGDVQRDANGKPILECLCGKVISGTTDPEASYFTTFGSFWSNSTTDLLNTNSFSNFDRPLRGRCISSGYESMALVPLKNKSKIYGLLQLNDKHKNRFTLDLIHFFEGIAGNIALLLASREAQRKLANRAEDVSRLVTTRTAQLNRIANQLQAAIDQHDLESDTVTPTLKKLYSVVSELETLRGIKTICCGCKKIRTPENIWEHVESYISQHSLAEFSHSYCPDCYQAFNRELKKKKATDA